LSLRLVASNSNDELVWLNGYESWLQNFKLYVIEWFKVQISGKQKLKSEIQHESGHKGGMMLPK
jgi:hypothetical protein